MIYTKALLVQTCQNIHFYMRLNSISLVKKDNLNLRWDPSNAGGGSSVEEVIPKIRAISIR